MLSAITRHWFLISRRCIFAIEPGLVLVFGMCRGIVTADVLEQGLSPRAIALGSLKGLIGTKDTRGFYTSSAPYGEGKAYL